MPDVPMPDSAPEQPSSAIPSPAAPAVVSPSPSPSPSPSGRGFKIWYWLAIVILIACGSGGGGYALGRHMTKSAPPMTMMSPSLTLPASATVATTCAVGLGRQYISPANVPNGPLYNVMDGKVIGLEMMFNAAEIKATPERFRHIDLAGHGFRYLDIGYVIEGHAGNSEPHYHLDLFTEAPSVADNIKCASSDGSMHDSMNPDGHATH